MNTRSRIVAIVLMLAMVLGTFTMLTIGASAEEAATEDTPAATADGVTMETVEDFLFADNYYQADWSTNGKLNTYKNQLLKNDNTNDMLSWAAPDAVGETADVTLENGELSFINGTIWGYATKIMPGNMTSDKLGIGPTMIGFDLYMGNGSGMTGYTIFNINGGKLLNVNLQYGHVYYGDTWADYDETAAGYQWGSRPAGWYTIELIFIPLTAEGVICTTENDVIANTKVYLRVSKATDTIGEEPYNIAPAELATWKSYDRSMTDYYVNLESTAVIGFDNSGKAGTFKIRRAKSSNIIPFVTPELPEVTFEGFESLTEYVEADTTITLPSKEEVIAWELNGKYYFGGDQFVVKGHTHFVPVLREFYQVVKGHDTSSLWATGEPKATSWGTVYHSAEGTSPKLQWYGTKDVIDGSASGYTYDATEKAVMIYKGGWNQISMYPKKSSINGVSFTGANCIAASFDLKYTAGGGVTIKAADKNITVSNTGEVKISGSSVAIATLNEGWNNFQFYYVPVAFDAADPTVPTAYKIFVAVNASEIGNSVTMANLMSYAHYDWSAGALAEGDNFSITFNASAAAIPVGFRNIKFYRLDEKSVNIVSVQGTRDLQVVENGAEYTLPAVTGGDKWLAQDTVTKVVHVKSAGEKLTVSNDVDLIPATTDASKFKGASITLGGEMALNMKVAVADVTTGTNMQGIGAFADGTALNAFASATTEMVNTSTGAVECYSMTFSGIRAADMATDLDLYVVTIVDSKYYISASAQVYSPLKYIERNYAKVIGEVKSLLGAMAIYGAVAEEGYYGTSAMRTAVNNLGITAPTLPSDASAYTNAYVEQADKDAINANAQVGAILTNGVNLVFEMTNTNVASIVITTGDFTEEYAVVDTKATVTGLHAGNIRTLFTITFCDEAGETIATADYAIGNFLEYVRTNPQTDMEKEVAAAAINYMLAVRSYVLGA